MKRVAIVEYLMSAGGVERVLRGLARAFLTLPEARKWDITFLLSRYNSAHIRCDWPTELTGPNVRVEWLGEGNALSRALDPIAHAQGVLGIRATRIPLYLVTKGFRSIGPHAWRARLGDPYALIARASERFDLMYFTYPFWMGVPPMRVPVLTTPQDFNFKHFLKEGTWVRRVQERSTRAWLERADRLLLSSEAVQGELRQFYPEYETKAEVVRLGIDIGRAPPSPTDIETVRRARGLPPEFMLVTGWVMPHKNQLAVVRAMSELRASGVALPVVFAGPNTAVLAGAPSPSITRSYVDEVKDALSAGGFSAGRDFFALGYVTDAEIRALYSMATVFVCPSTYEGFGLPGLEAMLAGCPVLLSAIPPFEEQNRLLGGIIPTFDPNDASALAKRVAWLVSHRDEARTTARVAAERVPGAYDWDKTARGYLDAFDRVLTARHA